MKQTLKWTIDGEFITNLAREWFWIEHKPYHKVEELLASCMVSDQLSDSERKELISEIINGRLKLVSSGDQMKPEDDHYNPIPQLTGLIRENQKLKGQIEDLENQVNSITEDRDRAYEFVERIESYLEQKSNPIYKMRRHLAHTNIIDNISFNNIFKASLKRDADKVQYDFNEFCDSFNIFASWQEHGFFRWLAFFDKDTNEILDHEEIKSRGICIPDSEDPECDSDLEESDTEEEVVEYKDEPYGWLAPDGQFKEAPFGEHEGLAFQIIKERGWEQDYWKDDIENHKEDIYMAGDYLVKKGYILLHNPMAFGSVQVQGGSRMTKAQREFLYQYFIDYGYPDRANSLYEEGS